MFNCRRYCNQPFRFLYGASSCLEERTPKQVLYREPRGELQHGAPGANPRGRLEKPMMKCFSPPPHPQGESEPGLLGHERLPAASLAQGPRRTSRPHGPHLTVSCQIKAPEDRPPLRRNGPPDSLRRQTTSRPPSFPLKAWVPCSSSPGKPMASHPGKSFAHLE